MTTNHMIRECTTGVCVCVLYKVTTQGFCADTRTHTCAHTHSTATIIPHQTWTHIQYTQTHALYVQKDRGAKEITTGLSLALSVWLTNTHTHTHRLCAFTTDSYINLQRTKRSILILLVMTGQTIKKLLDGYNYCLVGQNIHIHTLSSSLSQTNTHRQSKGLISCYIANPQ